MMRATQQPAVFGLVSDFVTGGIRQSLGTWGATTDYTDITDLDVPFAGSMIRGIRVIRGRNPLATLSVVSCQLSVVSCQLSVVSCQLSVCQLSVVS